MPKTILIVDDVAEHRFTLKARLEFEGFAVMTAKDGEEALEKIPQTRPDLVLMDVMMPGLNGCQVCLKLRRDPQTRDIPVIMVTAKSQQNDKLLAEDVGANDYITKPFDMNALIEKIRMHMESTQNADG